MLDQAQETSPEGHIRKVVSGCTSGEKKQLGWGKIYFTLYNLLYYCHVQLNMGIGSEKHR